LRVESSVITHVGLVRRSNEDNYYVNGKYKSVGGGAAEGYADSVQRKSYVYAVCDGMGGESFGELASMIAVKTLSIYQETDLRQTITEYVKRANMFICKEMEKFSGARIGTTLAILFINNNRATAYNIGDSRVYLLRSGDLFLLTEDHTEAQRMVELGMIHEDEAEIHPARNKLTQHLGIYPDEMIIEPYISQEIKLKKNDVLLVCSDGLTDMVDADELREILSMEGSNTTEIAKELAATAQAYGGRDNTTAIVIQIT